ncbi:MAG: HAMP domain-containing protein [Haloarculaceae archaeon]
MSESDGDDTDPSESLFQRAVPNFVRRSFALKFALVLLVMGLSVGVIGIAATQVVKSQERTSVQNQYTQIARQESDLVEQWVEQNRLSTQLVSSNDVWGQDQGLRTALNNQESRLRDVHAMHLVQTSLTGTHVIASTNIHGETNVSAAGRAWLSDVNISRTGGIRMSNVYRVDGEPVVGFVSPVAASQDRYLVIEFSLNDIAGSLQGAESADGGFTQVVNTSGTVLIDEAPDPDGGLGDEELQSYSGGNDVADRVIVAANSFRSSSSQRSGVNASMPANGQVIDEPYTVGYAPVGGTDWVVLTHAPSSSVFGFARQIEQWGLIATVVEVLLVGGVGAAMGYSTSTAIDRLTSKTEAMREGDLDVDIATSRIDNVGRLYDGFAAMRDALQEQISEAERARKEAEVSRAEAMEMNDYLQEKAEEFSGVMEAASAGDLTERMETDGENEAMDRIADEFNVMIEELEKTVGQLTSFADEVAESGDVVLQSAESVRDASEQVADSVQKMSDDAYDQRERLQTLSEDMDDLVATLEDLEAEHDELELDESLTRFREVARTLQEAADTSDRMMAESENVAGAAEEQAAELNEVSSRADRLKRYARPLGDILNRFDTEAEHEFVFSGGPSQAAREAATASDEETTDGTEATDESGEDV